jgi:molybdate transport system regulatory protein
MNRLLGTIAAIESNDHFSLVDVVAGQHTFTALLLETPQNAPYLKLGNTVAVLFKETEVALAKNLSGQISLRNRIKVIVRQIRRGDILCKVVLDRNGQALASIITTRAVEQLELQEGDEVEALVKANEVSLMEVRDEL